MTINRYLEQYHAVIFCTAYLMIAILAYNYSLRSITTLNSIDQSLETVDLVIFSYDRPIQLYALLESIHNNLQGLESTTVIYRSSNDQFTQAYKRLENIFPSTYFMRQGSNPAQDFKPLVLQAFKAGKAPYICFAVDDIIVKERADLQEVTRALANTNAYGFFLRLGTHLTSCYTENKSQPVPPLTPIYSCMNMWTFKDGTHDWGYAHTVDMTIYRKKDIIEDFATIAYTNPNRLEGRWSKNTQKHLNDKGLCYDKAIVVNIPTNLVQDVCNNRHMNAWTTAQLLEKFNNGQKIDISAIQGIRNESCHIDFTLSFINQ